MKSVLLLLSLSLGFGTPASAQHGTAPNGYYPGCSAGDMWTGTLGAVDDGEHSITLTYVDAKQNRPQTFVGVIKDGYIVSRRGGPPHQLKPSELPLGAQLTVYYCIEHKKVGGGKTTVNEVFRINNVTNLKKQMFEFKGFR